MAPEGRSLPTHICAYAILFLLSWPTPGSSSFLDYIWKSPQQMLNQTESKSLSAQNSQSQISNPLMLNQTGSQVQNSQSQLANPLMLNQTGSQAQNFQPQITNPLMQNQTGAQVPFAQNAQPPITNPQPQPINNYNTYNQGPSFGSMLASWWDYHVMSSLFSGWGHPVMQPGFAGAGGYGSYGGHGGASYHGAGGPAGGSGFYGDTKRHEKVIDPKDIHVEREPNYRPQSSFSPSPNLKSKPKQKPISKGFPLLPALRHFVSRFKAPSSKPSSSFGSSSKSESKGFALLPSLRRFVSRFKLPSPGSKSNSKGFPLLPSPRGFQPRFRPRLRRVREVGRWFQRIRDEPKSLRYVINIPKNQKICSTGEKWDAISQKCRRFSNPQTLKGRGENTATGGSTSIKSNGSIIHISDVNHRVLFEKNNL